MNNLIKRQVLNMGFANVVEFSIQFFVPMLLVRYLSEGDFADYRLMWLLIGSLFIFCSLKIPQGLSYFLPASDEKNKLTWVMSSLVAVMINTGLITVIVYLIISQEWNGERLFDSEAEAIVILLFFWVMSSFLDWTPVSLEKAGAQSIIIIMSSIVRLGLILFVCLIDPNLNNIILAFLIYSIFKIVILLIYLCKEFGGLKSSFKKDYIFRQLKYSAPFGLAGAVYALRLQSVLWVVYLLIGEDEFVYLSLSVFLLPVLLVIRRSCSNVVFPKLRNRLEDSDKASISELNRLMTNLIALVSIPFIIFVICFSEEIVRIIYTQKYIEAAFYMQILMIGAVIQVLDSQTLLRLVGKGLEALKIDSVMLGIQLITVIAFVEIWGAVGAAVSLLLVMIVSHVVVIFKSCAFLGLKFYDVYDLGYLMKLIVISSVSGFASKMIFDHFFEVDVSILWFFMVAILYVITFLIGIYLARIEVSKIGVLR